MHEYPEAESQLSAYRTLDLTDEKGLFCGKILADLGADVVKIEPPGGDPTRNIGPFHHDIPNPEASLFWSAYNTNKRGITLNLETRDGQQIFKRLAINADFIIESFPPGYMDKLGLGYPVLSEINPRIVMTSITPFGQAGPYKDYVASDITEMAMGGLMYICGDADRPPVRISADQAYLHGAAQAAIGTLIAHWYREKTGEGQYVDVSIQESVIWTLMYTIPYWDFAKRLFSRSGNRQTRFDVAYRLIYPCKDGHVCYRLGTGPGLGPMQARLVKAMDSKGMAEGLKEVNWAELSFDRVPQSDINRWEESMSRYFLKHSKMELLEEAVKRDYMLFPVFSIKEILEYPQLAARRFWTEVNHTELDTVIMYPGTLFKSNEAQPGIACRAPLIGEHNEEIYEMELGLSNQELVALKQANII